MSIIKGKKGLYNLKVGLEVHVQLSTKTKLFSRSKSEVESYKPNINVNSFDIGTPGTLPLLNRECVRQAIKFGLIIKGDVSKHLIFDRKHYFYSDLPHGFQITQQRCPIITNGFLYLPEQLKYAQIRNTFKPKKIPISHVQLEMDSAKSFYDKEVNKIFIDYNRAGIALLEIVTDPVIDNIGDTIVFIRELQNNLRNQEISECKLEDGSMRADVNISLHPQHRGSCFKPGKVEVKNLNSLKSIEKSIEFEICRQLNFMESNNKPIPSETRSFNVLKNQTEYKREKTNKYIYTIEPNLPIYSISESYIEKCRAEMNELLSKTKDRLVVKYNINPYLSHIISENKNVLKLFEDVALIGSDPNKVGNFIVTDIFGELNKQNININEIIKYEKRIKELIESIDDLRNTGKLKYLTRKIIEGDDRSIKEIIIDEEMEEITNDEEISSKIKEMFFQHKDDMRDKNDKNKLHKYIFGRITQKYKGRINTSIIQSKLDEIIRNF